MSYAFPPELQRLVADGVASGECASEDEVLLEAMRLLRDRDAHWEEFRDRLRVRLDRLDRGEGLEFEDEAALRGFFDDVQARGRERFEAGRGGA